MGYFYMSTFFCFFLFLHLPFFFFFFFNDTATTEIYTLSLHDALPIWCGSIHGNRCWGLCARPAVMVSTDRKSTRLNSSHSQISYAVFCLKKKKKETSPISMTSRITR